MAPVSVKTVQCLLCILAVFGLSFGKHVFEMNIESSYTHHTLQTREYSFLFIFS